MAKRTAASDLNHDNWDRDDEPEEAGTFVKASDDDIKRRVIRVAKRRNPLASHQGEDGRPSPFGGFAGFGNKPVPTGAPETKSSVTSGNMFGFLSNLNKDTAKPANTNGISAEKTSDSNTNDKKSDNMDEYYSKLKGLNESVLEWIRKHVTDNPLLNLQPIFKDYSKYFTDLEKLKETPNSSMPSGSHLLKNSATSQRPGAPATPSKLTFGIDPKEQQQPQNSSPMRSFASTKSTQAQKTPEFKFGIPTSTGSPSNTSVASTVTVSSGFSFSSQKSSGSFSFGGSAQTQTATTSSPPSSFKFTSTVIKPAVSEGSVQEKDEETTAEDEPPKAEFTPVVEEGHVYSTRCKVFVKRGDTYSDRGVGNLFLKPVPSSEKVQLIVRADTNLGNLLCNFILSGGIPIKRMGKKDVMLICLPTPDSAPPPVPVLLRVKSPDAADELLEKLQNHQK